MAIRPHSPRTQEQTWKLYLSSSLLKLHDRLTAIRSSWLSQRQGGEYQYLVFSCDKTHIYSVLSFSYESLQSQILWFNLNLEAYGCGLKIIEKARCIIKTQATVMTFSLTLSISYIAQGAMLETQLHYFYVLWINPFLSVQLRTDCFWMFETLIL